MRVSVYIKKDLQSRFKKAKDKLHLNSYRFVMRAIEHYVDLVLSDDKEKEENNNRHSSRIFEESQR